MKHPLVPPPSRWIFSHKVLQEYMQKHGLSGDALADLLGVDRTTAFRWKRGEVDMSYADWAAMVFLTS